MMVLRKRKQVFIFPYKSIDPLEGSKCYIEAGMRSITRETESLV